MMTHLDTILGTLLLRNNCVIIPSLGGFVANYVSAKVDIKNGLISPPQKALSFNKNLKTNDGLIIHHLAYKKNISFDEAKSIIDVEVQKIKAELNKGRRIHFNNVGFIYINNAGKIAFEQERFFNLLLSSYGLGSVQFISETETDSPDIKKEVKTKTQPSKVAPTQPEKTVETPRKREEKRKETQPTQETQEPKVVPIAEKTSQNTEKADTDQKITVSNKETTEENKEVEHPAITDQKTSKGLIGKIIKYAAVAALVPVLFYSFWIPMKTDVLQSGIVYQEDFNPFYKAGTLNYSHESNQAHLDVDSVKPSETLSSIIDNLSSPTPVFTYPLDEDLYVPVSRKSRKTQPTKEVVQKASKATSSTQSNNYHAIVGCFSNPSNAKKVIKRLKVKGFNAYEVDVKGGLHRISAGGAKTRSAMQSFRQSLTNKDIPSWVLKK